VELAQRQEFNDGPHKTDFNTKGHTMPLNHGFDADFLLTDLDYDSNKVTPFAPTNGMQVVIPPKRHGRFLMKYVRKTENADLSHWQSTLQHIEQ
jgi:hypothetical protein